MTRRAGAGGLHVVRSTVSAFAVIATAISALPSSYLGLLTAVGCRRSERPGPGGVPITRFVICVPAHDEEGGIADTLASFRALDYPAGLFEVHVVADNCSDDTVGVVERHGYRAHDRRNGDDPGKGPALNWLHRRLLGESVGFDALVIVDADTTLDESFLTAMDRAMVNGAMVAQGFYSVREPTTSPSVSLRYAALACRHHVRPLGRCRLGGSCGLYGNGMVFRREVLERHHWSGHLVEDAELQMELLLDGILVTYVPGAQLEAEMPATLEQSETQHQRWEAGRADVARRYVPALLRRLHRGRHRAAHLDAVADHLVPPISVLAVLDVVALTSAATGTGLGGRWARGSLLIAVTSTAVLVCHVLGGLWAVRAAAEHYRNMSQAPKVMFWKFRLFWGSVIRHDADVVWQRTPRNTEAST